MPSTAVATLVDGKVTTGETGTATGQEQQTE